jgi:hypothetical protein
MPSNVPPSAPAEYARAVSRSKWFLLLLACACTPTPERKEMLDRVPDATMTRTQVRARSFAYLSRFTVLVARAADQISAATDSEEIQQRARLWKLNATRTMGVVATHEDPVAALLASWAFAASMHAFLRDGAGKELFGDEQRTAVETSAQLEAEVESIAAALSHGKAFEGARDLVAAHVRDYPQHDLYFTLWREDDPLIDRLEEADLDVFSVAASLEDRTAHLAAVIRYYAMILPQVAAWEGEGVATDLVGEVFARDELRTLPSKLDAIIRSLDHLAADVDRVSAVIGNAATLLSEQREAAIESLRAERIAVMEGVTGERVAAIEALRAERKVVMEGITGERVAALDHVSAMVDRENEFAVGAVNRAIDRFWLRGLLALGVLVGAAGLLGFGAALLLLRRRSRPASS